jgi:hypothetical protein
MRIGFTSRAKALTILVLGLLGLGFGAVELYRVTQLTGLQRQGKCDYLACGPATEPSFLLLVALAVLGSIVAVLGAWLLLRAARRAGQSAHSM